MRKLRKWRCASAIAMLAAFVAATDGIAGSPTTQPSEHEVTPELPDVEKVLSSFTAERLALTRDNLIRYVWKGLDPYKLKPSAVVDGARTGNISLVAAADAKTIYVTVGGKF